VDPCTFVMGSPEDELGRCDDETQHEVTLTRGYSMGVVPVTQALWTAVMGSNPSDVKDGPEAPQRPVVNMSWYDALRFCNAASVKAGLRPVYEIGAGNEAWNAQEADQPKVTMAALADGFRLPTEAEWECAARAGTRHVYAGGDDLDAVGWLDEFGAFDARCRDTAHPVAQKRANAWGLHDMSGNVEEWCWDRYGAYAPGRAQDTTGPEVGRYRVCRGGSWIGVDCGARASSRSSGGPGNRYGDHGLRLARTIPQSSNP
jgi:formylglycine-generating enzyme required for sulfatase activity